jgi:hypothetical protein
MAVGADKDWLPQEACRLYCVAAAAHRESHAPREVWVLPLRPKVLLSYCDAAAELIW